MKPLRMGLYGCGARTNAIIDSVRDHNLVQVACCYDVKKQICENTAEKYAAKAVDSAEELIADTGVDAFLISLAPKFHTGAAIEAAGACKPIFLEKPIACNLEDGKRVVDAIKGAGIVCHVGLCLRYVPVFKKVTEFIQSGQVGKIIGIHNHWVSWAAAIPILINEGPEMNWRGDPETGGQLVYHYCHFFDLLRVWGGEFVSVTAISNHLIFPKSPSENEIFMTLEYESGALAGCHFSEVSKQANMLGRVEGSEMTIEYEWSENSSMRLYKQNKRLGPRTPDEVLTDFGPDEGPREIMTDFVKAVNGEQPVKVTIEDGYVPLVVATAARMSEKEGRRVYLHELR